MKSISDMYFAAALLSYGTPYLGTNKQDPKRQQFSFDGVVPSILVFKDDGITVEKINNPTILQAELFCTSARLWYPPSYPDSLRKIKSIIHNQE